MLSIRGNDHGDNPEWWSVEAAIDAASDGDADAVEAVVPAQRFGAGLFGLPRLSSYEKSLVQTSSINPNLDMQS